MGTAHVHKFSGGISSPLLMYMLQKDKYIIVTYPILNNTTQFQSVEAIYFEDMMNFVCGELMPLVANLCPQAVALLKIILDKI